MPGLSHAPDSRPPKPPRARVVVLHRPGAAVPEALAEALGRNHSEPIAVDHALGAMTHLRGAKAVVLLLCEPDKLIGVRELLAAVERYTPRVTRWEYIPGENPPLRPIGVHAPAANPTPTPAPAPAETGPGNTGPGGAMRSADPFALRLAKDGGTSNAGRSASVGDLLTRDEMEALFSEDSP